MNDMNPGWSPAHERAATLPFDGQAASARLDARQTAKERRPSDNSTAASPLVRFLYWIYERRLLNQRRAYSVGACSVRAGEPHENMPGPASTVIECAIEVVGRLTVCRMLPSASTTSKDLCPGADPPGPPVT